MPMKVPDGWKGREGRFKCGLFVMKDVVKVRNENEKLKRQMEQMIKGKKPIYTKIKIMLKHGQPLLRG